MRRSVALGLLVVASAGLALVAVARIASRGLVPDDTARLADSPRQRTFDDMRRAGDGAIYVEDQPAGTQVVVVGFAVMRDPGFVEIRSDDGGHPGVPIGRSAALPAGGGEHVLVTLDGSLAEGRVYYAVLLDAQGVARTDAQGDVVLMSFVARRDAAPETGAVEP